MAWSTSSATAAAWASLASRGSASMLLAPTSQTSANNSITELRVLSGPLDRRYTLPRTIETVQTRFGPIRIKRSGSKAKAEYDDAAAAAKAHGVTLAEVLRELPL